MAGIRIQHIARKDCVLVVPHPGDPRTGRRPKDYFVTLDADGCAIVSETVWKRLQESVAAFPHPNNHWVVINEVLAPPTLLVGGGGPAKRVFTTEDLERAPFAPPKIKD
jgi:hypothetical protein